VRILLEQVRPGEVRRVGTPEGQLLANTSLAICAAVIAAGQPA
jgi:hypothetical protein